MVLFVGLILSGLYNEENPLPGIFLHAMPMASSEHPKDLKRQWMKQRLCPQGASVQLLTGLWTWASVVPCVHLLTYVQNAEVAQADG